MDQFYPILGILLGSEISTFHEEWADASSAAKNLIAHVVLLQHALLTKGLLDIADMHKTLCTINCLHLTATSLYTSLQFLRFTPASPVRVSLLTAKYFPVSCWVLHVISCDPETKSLEKMNEDEV